MATDTRNIVFSNATDTTFRTWVIAWKAALSAIGLTQTADTGQIDTATVLTPSAVSQNRGVAVYTPNDGLTDYYLIFGFGSGATGALQPQIYLTIAWATDGASNAIGTQVSTQISDYLSTAASAVTTNIFSCKTGSAIAFSINENGDGAATVNRSFISIDRDRDQSTGSAQTTGVSYWGGGTSGIRTAGTNVVTVHQRIPVTGGVGAVVINNLPCIFPRTTGTWGRGSNVGVGAVIPWDSGMWPQTISLLVGSQTDFAIATTGNTVSLYGTSHSFRTTGSSGGGQNTGSRVLIPWE